MSKYSIVTLQEVESTNSYALENLSYLDDRTVIYTNNQTGGRGRYNRKWVYDKTENIFMSLILKPKYDNNYPYTNLTQYLSVILCKFLENEFNLIPKIKWPNDILINNSKISGILAESSMKNNKIEGIVLGLGLNVNMDIKTLESIDQKACSLYSLTSNNYDCEKILRKLLDLFFDEYPQFINNGFKYIKEDYTKRCEFLGKNITLKENKEQKNYKALSIDEDGLLLVQDKDNKEYKIITGDILC